MVFGVAAAMVTHHSPDEGEGCAIGRHGRCGCARCPGRILRRSAPSRGSGPVLDIVATDRAARRRFGTYWLIVRAGSGLIRLMWLHAAKKRAENGRP
jgi:hypothetical protein